MHRACSLTLADLSPINSHRRVCFLHYKHRDKMLLVLKDVTNQSIDTRKLHLILHVCINNEDRRDLLEQNLFGRPGYCIWGGHG